METRTSKKIRLMAQVNEHDERSNDGRLTDLPDDILHHILSFLPIKCIAQLSAVSKRWRYLWVSFPILDFSKVCGLMPYEEHRRWFTAVEIYDYQSKVVNFISTVLSRRHENTNIKVFGFTGYMNSIWLRDWIPWLVKHSVEELELHVWLIHNLDLPRCVFKCDSMRKLTLKASSSLYALRNLEPRIRFPSSYVRASTGLRALHTLSLSRVNFAEDDLFSDSSFPLLENLTVEDCRITITSHLKIYCSNLKYILVCSMTLNGLDISGRKLRKLTVEHCLNGKESWVNIFAPNLQTFYWKDNDIADKYLFNFPTLRTGWINNRSPVNVSKLKIHRAVDLLSSLSQVQILCLGLHSLQILSKIYFECGLPYSFMKLEYLVIYTGLSKSEVAGMACIFMSSPLVHTLIVAMTSTCRQNNDDKWNNILLDNADCTEEQFWETQAQTLNPFLCRLKAVKFMISENTIHESVINLARFFLEHGKNLQAMSIPPYSKAYDLLAWKNKIGIIEGFPRASADVKIYP